MTKTATKKTKIFAHRGASKYAPENTLPAFQAAETMGADGVELDVHRTRDGHVVVCHDEIINRTSNGSGYVAEYTLAELQQFDFSDGQLGFEGTRIPTLAEVFDLLGPTNQEFNIELKNSIVPYPGLEDEVVDLVHQAGLDDRVLYSSFNHRSMHQLAKRGYHTGLLYETVMWRPVRYAAQMGAYALHPADTAVRINPGLVRKAHRKGIAVNVWTVDSPDLLRSMMELGVDAVITNVPDIAAAIRNNEDSAYLLEEDD